MIVEIAEFYIAGLQYCSEGSSLMLYCDDYLTLKKDIDNSNDAYAIAIFKDDIKLGYVPKGRNFDIYEYIQEDINIKVVEFNPNLPPWERIKVVIFLEE